MDEAGLRARLNGLKQQHRALDIEIGALDAGGILNQIRLQKLKKRKLALKDEIAITEDQLLPDIIA